MVIVLIKNNPMLMKQLLTIFFILTSFRIHSLASENIIKCTDNVLKQIYPNQNVCVLQKSIPSKLQGLPFVTYPVEISHYNTERFHFNKHFNIFPKAIIAPKSFSTLSKVLHFGKQRPSYYLLFDKNSLSRLKLSESIR